MTQGNPPQLHSYELPLTNGDPLLKDASSRRIHSSLPLSFLRKNIFWFCRIRWVLIVILVSSATLGFFPEMFYPFGLKPRADWPFVVAGILVAANLVYLWHARKITSTTVKDANLNLWSQIVLDLLMVTVTVHYIGCLETYAPFIYLFHIVLACIFFSRRQSFVIIVIACVLYVGCVFMGLALESPQGIYVNSVLRTQMEEVALFNVTSAIAIWLGVWILASRLSVMIRDQSNELEEKNRLLVDTQEKTAKSMLHTTHELKAPFAAIQVNTQLLLRGECGVVPDKVREIIRRIDERSRWLSFEIQEMLQLADLRSTTQESLNWIEVNLTEMLRWCMDQVRPMAQERKIKLDVHMEPTLALVVEDHIKMLFRNLLANAVTYSHENGIVRITCKPDSQKRPIVTIEDNGIGIPKDKLPKIFDEYYRTNEALKHNKISTGLGLAIVRHVAETHRIGIKVESKEGAGTKFSLLFPTEESLKVTKRRGE
jgi:signal transduction histidine kinase